MNINKNYTFKGELEKMIPIKFKAIVEGKEYKVVDIGFNSSGLTDITLVDSFDGDWSERVVKYPLDMIKLLRYTGLKDKNGKEICEGDIIKGRYKELSIIDDIRYAIIGSDECKTNWKVIGNIYENPELIE